MHLQQCYRLISQGKQFTVSKDGKRVTDVSESALNDFKIDLSL